MEQESRLSDRIADSVLSMITVEKRFLPGSKLPNENILSAKPDGKDDGNYILLWQRVQRE